MDSVRFMDPGSGIPVLILRPHPFALCKDHFCYAKKFAQEK